MGEANLIFGFTTSDAGAVVRALIAVGWINPQPPENLWLNHDEAETGDDWVERALVSRDVTAIWADRITKLAVNGSGLVNGERPGVELSADNVLAVLSKVPFTVASFGIHPWDGYDGPSFGRGHDPHGGACAFKGTGHDRLVSRRWLGTGPWRVLRGSGDLTLVQFHDPAASESAALTQAKPGHRTMGIDPHGGYLQANYVYKTDLEALYSNKQRALIFVVKGRSVEPIEMRDAAAARKLQPFGADKPIDHVVYVFFDEAAAKKHLPLLWSYGHEVRLIGDDGVERRIDEGYQPTLDKPAWVAKLGRDDSKEFLT